MIRKALSVVALSLALVAPSAHAKVGTSEIGVTTVSGVTIPLNTFKSNRFKALGQGLNGLFKLGVSYSIGTQIVVNGMELGYAFNTFSFKGAKAINGQDVQLQGMPRLQMHQFGIGYRIYFTKGIVRPYLPVGLGFLLFSGSQAYSFDRSYGVNFNTGAGIEIRLYKFLYAVLDFRYHFNVIFQPAVLKVDFATLQQGAMQVGDAYTSVSVSGTNPIKEALSFLHYMEVRFGLSLIF